MRPRGLMTLAARGMLMAVVSVAVTAAIGAAAAAALAQCPPGLRAALAASAVLAEVAFAAYYWLLHARRLGCRITTSPADICPISIRDKMLHAIKHEDPRQMLIGWFRGCERFEDIHRDNITELFSYAIWYRTPQEMADEGLAPAVEELVAAVERSVGCSLPPGRNSSLRFMAHVWEPLRHVYRSLAFYLVMEALAGLTHAVMWGAGFSCHTSSQGVTYYTLISNDGIEDDDGDGAASSTAAGSGADVPLLFLHGVGAGLLPYLWLLVSFAGSGRTLIVPLAKQVSMRLCVRVHSIDDMVDACAEALSGQGFEAAAVVGHSYGSMVAARLARTRPAMVHSLGLLDPVCFAMYAPDLVKNFFYQRHISGCHVIDVIMALVSSELHCAAAFSRGFTWTGINMWHDDLPPRTLVVLSGRDILAPTARLHQWLQEHERVRVLHAPGMAHAGVLVNGRWQAEIVAAFEEVIATASPPPAAAVAAATVAESTQPVSEAAQCSTVGSEGGETADVAAAARVVTHKHENERKYHHQVECHTGLPAVGVQDGQFGATAVVSVAAPLSSKKTSVEGALLRYDTTSGGGGAHGCGQRDMRQRLLLRRVNASGGDTDCTHGGDQDW